MKSPVLENCTPGSVRGAPGNRRPYRDDELRADELGADELGTDKLWKTKLWQTS